jgi:hypothetical protein
VESFTPTRTWNEANVRSLLYPADADEVMRIPIPSNPRDNFTVWAHEKTSILSVRSAYRLGMQLQQIERQTSTSTSPEGERALWNIIWKANVPPKIETFDYKLASNTLGV